MKVRISNKPHRIIEQLAENGYSWPTDDHILILLVNVLPGMADSVVNKLKTLTKERALGSYVATAFLTSGPYDLIAVIVSSDGKEFSRFNKRYIEKIPGMVNADLLEALFVEVK